MTEACGTLQRSGLIRYRHGHITVVDRAGLEAAACECYTVAAVAYTELLGPLVDGKSSNRVVSRRDSLTRQFARSSLHGYRSKSLASTYAQKIARRTRRRSVSCSVLVPPLQWYARDWTRRSLREYRVRPEVMPGVPVHDQGPGARVHQCRQGDTNGAKHMRSPDTSAESRWPLKSPDGSSGASPAPGHANHAIARALRLAVGQYIADEHDGIATLRRCVRAARADGVEPEHVVVVIHAASEDYAPGGASTDRDAKRLHLTDAALKAYFTDGQRAPRLRTSLARSGKLDNRTGRLSFLIVL